MNQTYTFSFGGPESWVSIQNDYPTLEDITAGYTNHSGKVLLVCDTNTSHIARQIRGGRNDPVCVVEPGESTKTWETIETILRTAYTAGLGRDGIFVGVGGGVVSDMTAFAASVYMRGAGLCLVSTSLLGMADAAVGGKTGFDLFGMKNFAGTFYPAARIYMPVAALKTLPKTEWKSGMAEIIKTAILDTSDEADAFWRLLEAYAGLQFCTSLTGVEAESFGWLLEAVRGMMPNPEEDLLVECIARSVGIKGRIVEADPKETGEERVLLNLGHTFGHALESAAGLGRISHGEAVAWGIVRACELGQALGITPAVRGAVITELLQSLGYETAAPHPLIQDSTQFLQALQGDKKKKAGALRFIVPAETGAVSVSGEQIDPLLITTIIKGSTYDSL